MQFSGIPKQKFTFKLQELQGNVALNSEIEYYSRDSWLYPQNCMNQDMFIPSKYVAKTSYKYVTFHELTLIYLGVFINNDKV